MFSVNLGGKWPKLTLSYSGFVINGGVFLIPISSICVTSSS